MGGEDNFGPIIPLGTTANESLTSNAFSYRAALDYHVTKDVLAYASIATGYKSGDFNGSFLSLDPTQIARQLQPVKPERVTAYELGLKTSWFDRRLVADAAAFYNDYSDLQIFELVPFNGIGVNVLSNAEAAHTQGVEVQLTARPVSALTASVNMGWLNTRLDKVALDRRRGQRSRWSASNCRSRRTSPCPAWSTTRSAVGENMLDAQFSANYKSHQYFDTTNDPYTTQKGYWLEQHPRRLPVRPGPHGGRRLHP